MNEAHMLSCCVLVPMAITCCVQVTEEHNGSVMTPPPRVMVAFRSSGQAPRVSKQTAPV